MTTYAKRPVGDKARKTKTRQETLDMIKTEREKYLSQVSVSSNTYKIVTNSLKGTVKLRLDGEWKERKHPADTTDLANTPYTTDINWNPKYQHLRAVRYNPESKRYQTIQYLY